VAVSPIIPTHHIDLSSQKESEPVSIGTADHLLVQKSIWVAHYESGSILEGSSGIGRADIGIVVCNTGKEHAVQLGTIVSSHPEMLSIEVVLENQLILFDRTEHLGVAGA